MSQAQVADLETWIADVRSSLPQLNAKLSKIPGHGERVGSGMEGTSLQAEINLLEHILQHHDQLSKEKLESSELIGLLTVIHHGVQGCAQHAIDRATDPNDDQNVFACLGALADIDQRIINLGGTKPPRSGERKTSD